MENTVEITSIDDITSSYTTVKHNVLCLNIDMSFFCFVKQSVPEALAAQQCSEGYFGQQCEHWQPAQECVMVLTNEGAGKEGETNSQRSYVAVPRLSHGHSIDCGHEHKGHDELPQKQLPLSNGDSSLVSEAAGHAVATTHMHRGNQHCLQTMKLFCCDLTP